ncbi:MAG TPA: hypothetical protein VFB83_03360 [Propionibacteriaceae bacterium]|nr:hypothetical protein [Propionibacteriaceae bacterium]
MTDPNQNTATLTKAQAWFTRTGDNKEDIHRLINLIFDTQDNDDQLDEQGQLRQTTINGLIQAFLNGPETFPSIYAFVDAAWRLSDPDNDPPGTLADKYCQNRARKMASGLPGLPKVDETQFRAELRKLKIRNTCELGVFDEVCIVKNTAVWTDGIGEDIVVGFTAKTLSGDSYTILIRSVDPDATGQQIMQALWSVCDGQAAPVLTDLVNVTCFAVGGLPSGDSVVKSCQLLVELTNPQVRVHGTWLTASSQEVGTNKAIAVLADGTLCCTQYAAAAYDNFIAMMPQLPVSDQAFFNSAVAELKLPSVACTAGTVQLLQGNGLVVTSIRDCVVVGVRGAHQNTIYGAIVCGGSDTGTDTGEDLITTLLNLFDGNHAPLLTSLEHCKFFIFGGHGSLRCQRVLRQLLRELFERQLDVLGVRALLHADDVNLDKALMIKPDGRVVGTGFTPPEPEEKLNGVTLLGIDQLRGSAQISGYYEVGRAMNTDEYDQAWLMKNDGIWTDHMGPCVTVGFTGVHGVTGKRYNALVHSFNSLTRGPKLIEMLEKLPDYPELVNVGFFVIGGSPDDNHSQVKVVSVLQTIAQRKLTLIASCETISAEYKDMAKAVMITKDGRLFGAVYAAK